MRAAMSVLVVAAALCGAAPVAMERRETSAGWEAVSRTPDSHSIQLSFAVKQRRLDELERTLLRVSDPRSKDYGKHLSNEAVHELVAPDSADVDAVVDFIRSFGAEPIRKTPNSDFIEATVGVRTAEAMLSAQYSHMKHSESGIVVHRCDSYSLPERVARAVDVVSPTVHLPAPRSIKRVAPQPNALDNSPRVLRKLYSVGDAVGQAPANRMAVTAFLGQHYHVNDLHEFWTLFCGSLTCGKGDPVTKGDEVTGLSAGTEAMLDIQTVTGVAGNVSAEFWGFSGRSPGNKENEPFMSWLTLLSNTSDKTVPKIFSTSYGEDESSWSFAAATRLNTEFQKAGARGISLLYASGDEGANCKTPTGGSAKQFVPETPGSSPWVTAVGGTGGGASAGESAAGLSSGGFSNYWKMPAWQKDAVSAYLSGGASLPSPSMGYNTSGRAYPDISAQAEMFTVVVDMIPEPGVAGTSCASPTAAGVIALLNDLRLQQGKSTLGFLNPWIYQTAAQWNDVTKGVTNSNGCGGGWPAAAGWDAATGVGTPNYQKLAAVLSTLP
eukprot:TRINITY_DN1886_c0_g1_i1.p1 TRINITY_DN1886_c0_g1~~TRINITY_DN1886_c0_g1_i1.p1  ORF type:complete len:569 (+),score=213.11 TRINITY_DN1886_c0_g1_i1:52-1707(+)